MEMHIQNLNINLLISIILMFCLSANVEALVFDDDNIGEAGIEAFLLPNTKIVELEQLLNSPNSFTGYVVLVSGYFEGTGAQTHGYLYLCQSKESKNYKIKIFLNENELKLSKQYNNNYVSITGQFNVETSKNLLNKYQLTDARFVMFAKSLLDNHRKKCIDQ